MSDDIYIQIKDVLMTPEQLLKRIRDACLLKHVGEDYLQKQFCPSCGCARVYTDDFMAIRNGWATRDCQCKECLHAWTEEYALIDIARE